LAKDFASYEESTGGLFIALFPWSTYV